MAQVWKVRLPDGRVLTPGDWTNAEPLWSVIEIAAGTIGTLSAFSYGINGDVPGSVGPRRSNFTDTNLEGEGGRLPENEELIVYNICVEFFTITAAGANDPWSSGPLPHVGILNMLRIQRDVNLTFKIAAVKDYTKHPVGYWPASTGIELYQASANDAANNGYIVGNNGGTSVFDRRELASPLYVAGGESFAVDFEFPRGAVNALDLGANGRIRARTFLDGYRRRPVA